MNLCRDGLVHHLIQEVQKYLLPYKEPVPQTQDREQVCQQHVDELVGVLDSVVVGIKVDSVVVVEGDQNGVAEESNHQGGNRSDDGQLDAFLEFLVLVKVCVDRQKVVLVLKHERVVRAEEEVELFKPLRHELIN